MKRTDPKNRVVSSQTALMYSHHFNSTAQNISAKFPSVIHDDLLRAPLLHRRFVQLANFDVSSLKLNIYLNHQISNVAYRRCTRRRAK